MQRKPVLIVALAVLVAAQVIAQTEYRVWDGKGSDHDGQDGQGSLDLDTPGCPTTFGAPTCEQQTSWTVDKTTASGPFEDPLNEPFSFNVTVTEGATSTVLTGSGQIVITNSGEVSAALSSIVVLLEDHMGGGGGDAPGPSGKNWQVLGAAIAVESALCEAAGVAKTCRGDILQTSGASLVLYDVDSNDIIALSDVLPVPPSTCADPLVINFSYEFDIEGLGIEGPGDGVVPSDDDLRIDLIATFGGAGPRGNSEASCTVDANCNGLIDPDNTATPDVDESELDNIRSIQQRLRFDPVPCDPACQQVTLTDNGAAADDPSCASVTSNGLNEMIMATGVEGTMSQFMVNGTVSCAGPECQTVVTNTATLTGAGCEGLIEGSPASASFGVTCSGGNGEPEPGDFCTQTQGGWGSVPAGNNTGTLLHNNFAAVFPSGIIVGDADGPDADGSFAIKLTSAQAVTNYLPAGGTPAVLTADQTDPLMTSSGVFGGQLVAATINIAFDAAGLRKDGGVPPFPPGTLATMVYTGCVDDDLIGLTVAQVIFLANTAVGGGGTPVGVTVSDLNDALTVLNQNFVDCDTNLGCLGLVSPPATSESKHVMLEQNVPNPFNPTTRIRFRLAVGGPVDLAVFDVTGRRVRRLADTWMSAGEHSVVWDARNDAGHLVTSGVYFYRLRAGGMVTTRRMLLLK